LLSAAKAVIA